jgi:hypothetical protein
LTEPAAHGAAVAMQHNQLAGVGNTSGVGVGVRYDCIGERVPVKVCP